MQFQGTSHFHKMGGRAWSPNEIGGQIYWARGGKARGCRMSSWAGYQRCSFPVPFGEWHLRMVRKSLRVCHSPWIPIPFPFPRNSLGGMGGKSPRWRFSRQNGIFLPWGGVSVWIFIKIVKIIDIMSCTTPLFLEIEYIDIVSRRTPNLKKST